ncbi:cytochrome P450 [Lentinula edodes]|uniref:Cytochrome P450 n=1 Tax=Lentinula lateritia TaxID=40482 RepID=A0A9W8ZRD2_9AGAR|nr:cytochrome P450 [Lentinula edodes]
MPFATVLTLVIICFCFRLWFYHARVPLDYDIFTNPRKSYESALEKYGPVIGVWRKGRLEYIVDDTLTFEVLTNHEAFSFRQGTATILNISYLMSVFHSFWFDMDNMVKKGITSHIDNIVERIAPVFEDHLNHIQHQKYALEGFDFFEYIHVAISEAMLYIIFGKREFSDRFLAATTKVAMNMATAGGFEVWREIQDYSPELDLPHPFEVTILQYLLTEWTDHQSFLWKLKRFLWMIILLIGILASILFASIHQTSSVATWIICEISARPDEQMALRAELDDLAPFEASTGRRQITHSALQNAARLDSFIREVLRTKGDTLSTIRLTTRDVDIGNATIPQGSLVIPLASLSHFSTKHHGHNAELFLAQRWCGQDKPAVMGSASYFPFGLGRWACPGRFLAINEIKIIAWSIIGRSTPCLKGNAYQITDPLNITSVPPKATIILQPLNRQLQGTRADRSAFIKQPREESRLPFGAYRELLFPKSTSQHKDKDTSNHLFSIVTVQFTKKATH